MTSDTPAPVTSETPAPVASGGAGTVVRRILVLVILFALVVIAANGIIGLLERLFDAGQVVVDDESGLARSLAFALIGAPLAAVLWWWERRRLIADRGERASLVWSLYVAAMSLTSLIVASVALAEVVTAGIDGVWRPDALIAAVVWAGVWFWHRHIRRSVATAPTRLVDLTVELSALYGLVVAVWGAIAALTALVSTALLGSSVLVASEHWLVPVLQAVAWSAIGAIVWWWHWFRERAMTASGAFAAVLLVIVIGAAAAGTLFAIGTLLFVLLRVLFGTDPVLEAIEPLDWAIATALVAAIVWAYHGLVLGTRSAAIHRAARLVVSAVALIGAASGFGVVVNALLATFGPALVENDPRTLLLGGISSLVVGGIAWWFAWRPARRDPEEAADPARRVYLVAVFGASAVVGIVTLLIIGYQVFEFLLDPSGTGGLVEQIRAPLGLLSATAIVFGYHFAVWRRDRASAPRPARRGIGRIVLVTAGDAAEQIARLRATTGASVQVWTAADPQARLDDEHLSALLTSLEGISARRLLIVAEPDGAARVTALAE